MKTVLLKDICKPKQWKTIPVSKLKDKGYPVYGANGIIGYWHEYNHEKPTILVTCRGATCGEINVSSPKSYITGNAMCLDGLDKNYSLDFIEAFLRAYDFGKVISGTAQPQITKSGIGQIPIPILSLSEQKILTERFRRILKLISLGKNALKIYDDLVKSRFVEMFGRIDKIDSSFVLWADVVEIINGKDYKTNQVKSGGYPVYGTGGEIARADSFLCPANSVIVGRKGTINNPLLITEPFWNVDTAFGIVPKENKMHYLYLYWFCKQFDFSQLNKSTTLPSTTKKDLLKIEIKLPEYALQQEFADFVYQVDKLKFDFDFLVSFSIPSICLFCLKLDP